MNPQPDYPFEFCQADALEFPLGGFDAIHASPPCQSYSVMSACRPGLAGTYQDLVATIRERLTGSGLACVIENVPGSPLKNPVTLCGQMFGLPLYRHRLFETNFNVRVPLHPIHMTPASKAGHWKPGTIMSISGHVSPIAEARRAMGIDWMSRDALVEAIPPAYTKFIGEQLRTHLRHAALTATTRGQT